MQRKVFQTVKSTLIVKQAASFFHKYSLEKRARDYCTYYQTTSLSFIYVWQTTTVK